MIATWTSCYLVGNGDEFANISEEDGLSKFIFLFLLDKIFCILYETCKTIPSELQFTYLLQVTTN